MRRRTFLNTVGSAMALSSFGLPVLAQTTRANTLKYSPSEGLAILDPHFTTIHITTMYGHNVYDTLYGVDDKFKAHPQMAEGHEISADGLTWMIRLRDGLKFHDGEPVRAQDCIASIKRWGSRNSLGLTLMGYVEEMTAADDRTIRIQLKSPFGVLPEVLATPVASPCFIMPERVAQTPITEQVTESIGSGPLKFNKGEFVPGQRAIFERNADYVPRTEAPIFTVGSKEVYFDIVDWNKIADQATATAALQSGEIDWLENVNLDLLQLLQSVPGVTVDVLDDGIRNCLRFNQSNAPFKDNPALRRAVASAIDQDLFTEALLGPNDVPRCESMYSCKLEGVPQLGADLMGGPKDYAAIAAKVKEAGYNGEKIVILSAVDTATVSPMGPVLVDTLQKIGMNVELQSMDINTYVSRRAMTEPVEQGGWSIFLFLINTPLTANPLATVYARGLGMQGYPGNNDDPELEGLLRDWIAAGEAERDAALNKVHAHLWETVPAVPLANYSTYTAYRSDLTGRVPMVNPVPWGIRRA